MAQKTIILVSNNTHFGIVHRIESALQAHAQNRPILKHFLVDQIQDPNFFTPYSDLALIIPIGAEALEMTLKSSSPAPILSILIRKHTFQQLTQTHLLQAAPHSLNSVSAIYLDQPLLRQINLIKEILPDIKSKGSVGVLFGPSSIHEQDELLKVAEENDIQLNTIFVNNFENPVAVMDAFLDEVKILLALPDNRIFNPHTARGILLTAFHKHVPLLGYSQSYAKNGALVSIFSNTKQIAQQTAETIADFLETNQLPPPQEPKDFSIEINYQVARSLNIAIHGENELQKKLKEKES